MGDAARPEPALSALARRSPAAARHMARAYAVRRWREALRAFALAVAVGALAATCWYALRHTGIAQTGIEQIGVPESGIAQTGAAAAWLSHLHPVWVGLVAFGCCGIAAGAALCFRRRGLYDVARSEDRRLGLDERLSTAVALASAGSAGPVKPVEQAFFVELEWLLASLEPPSAREAAPPWEALRPAALVALAALAVALLPNASSGLWRAGTERPVVQVELAGAAPQLRSAAGLLAARAEERSDPYLRAVARSMVELAEEIEGGRISPGEAAAELARLLSHAERALGIALDPGDGRDFGRELLLAFGGARPFDPGAGEANSASGGDGSGDVGDAPAPGRVGDEGGAGGERGGRRSDPRMDLETLLARLEGEQGGQGGEGAAASGPRPPAGAAGAFTDYSDAIDVAALEREVAAAARVRGMRGVESGEGGGGGDGASAQAGEGVQDPFGDAATIDLVGVDVEAVELGFDRSAPGRRILVEAAPQEEERIAGDVGLSGAGWRRSDEAALAREGIPLPNRSVVSRYFVLLHDLAVEPPRATDAPAATEAPAAAGQSEPAAGGGDPQSGGYSPERGAIDDE